MWALLHIATGVINGQRVSELDQPESAKLVERNNAGRDLASLA